MISGQIATDIQQQINKIRAIWSMILTKRDINDKDVVRLIDDTFVLTEIMEAILDSSTLKQNN